MNLRDKLLLLTSIICLLKKGGLQISSSELKIIFKLLIKIPVTNRDFTFILHHNTNY